jgi:hypothetical protein
MAIRQAGMQPLTDLEALLEPFGALLRRGESRHALERYTTGLLANIPHKTATAMGAALPGTNGQRLQELLTRPQGRGRPRKASRIEQRVPQQSAEELIAAQPEHAWSRVAWRQGHKGALIREFVAVPVHRSASRGKHLASRGVLVGERPCPGHRGEMKYYFAWGLDATDDCFAGERIHDLDAARHWGAYWCRHDYGMCEHSSTQRRPLALFEAEEQPLLRAPPSQPYDIPIWAEPKVARDQHVQLAKALYSVPRYSRGRFLVGRRIRARADRHTVRLYDQHELIKTHARQPAGARATDTNDFPAEQAATAQRDIAFIKRQARAYGPSIGAYAEALLDVALP